MKMKNKFGLASSEEEIMELLWAMGREMPSKEILDYFNNVKNKDWKKQTLNTFLFRLLERNYIKRTSEDRRYLYSPTITKKEYEQKKAEYIIHTAYQGSFLNFVSALSGGAVISKEAAENIKKLMAGE